MSASVETTDVLGRIGRYTGYTYDYSFPGQQYIKVGDLSKARAALLEFNTQQAPALYLSVRYYPEDRRLGVVWSDASANAAPLVNTGAIKMTDGKGAVLFNEEVNLQRFPPSRHGVLLGQTVESVAWSQLQVTVTLSCRQPTVAFLDKMESVITCSETMTALNSQQSPRDVCFVFPGMTAKLWASSEVLVDRSAYYESLLCSDFSESTMHTDSETAAATSNRAPVSDLFDDSDDETDEHFEAINMQPARLTRPDPLPRKEVVINDTAFTTDQATLVWMSSCYIRFAPLRSSCEGLTSGIHDSRMHIISEIIEANPRTSLPASPKSVYRLAHLLELKDLQEIALHNLHAQLPVRNAATELFSDVASAYPAVRDAILPYAVRNWAAVCTSSAYEKVKERADAGDLPIGAAHTALLLSERINERIKAP